MRPRDEVAKAYGYTNAQLSKRLRYDAALRRTIKETREIWESDKNVRERVRVKAAMLIEDGLLDVYSILTDNSVSPNVRVSSFESLAKVADVATPTKGDEGSGFSVVINLPQQDKPVNISPIIEHEDD